MFEKLDFVWAGDLNQVKELRAAVAGGLASEVEAILHRPQDPTIQVKRPNRPNYCGPLTEAHRGYIGGIYKYCWFI